MPPSSAFDPVPPLARRFLPAAVRWAAVPAGLLTATPALAQMGLQPNVGTDPRMGNLRPQLEQYFNRPPPLAGQPAWVFTPSIDVGVGFNDNVLQTNTQQKADVFTQITPSIAVSGDTSRLQVNLGYTPTIILYAQESSQNQVSQNGSAQAKLTVVPDAIFVDLRGNVSESSRTPGLNGLGTQTTQTQNNVTTLSAAITPYAEHRFGGWGTAKVGYSLARTWQNAEQGTALFNTTVVDPTTGAISYVPVTAGNNSNAGYGATGNLTTQRERASFTSGENLGRFNNITTLEAIQYYGSGSYQGAYRNEVQNQLGVALTRTITVLGGVGYQDLYFNGAPPVRINQGTWNFGVRYQPNPDTTVTLMYGHHDGASSVWFDGQVAPTARTRLTARYSEGITSDIENAQQTLDATTVGMGGALTDTATGTPVGLGGGYTGLQNGIYREKRFSAQGSYLRDRDVVSLSGSYSNRTTLSTLTNTFNSYVAPAGTQTTSITAALTWQHDLAPDMSATATVQYGVSNNATQLLSGYNGNQRTITFNAGLSKTFTETLSGRLSYTFTNQSTPGTSNTVINQANYNQNLVMLSVHKGF